MVERWCIKTTKANRHGDCAGRYMPAAPADVGIYSWPTSTKTAHKFSARGEAYAALAKWSEDGLALYEPRIVKLRTANVPEIPDSSPPRYITVRFKDSGSLLDASVLSFVADRGWVGGHVYKLVPVKVKRKKAERNG